MASDLTTVAVLFKHLYMDGQTAAITQRDHPLFARIDKQPGFVGDQFNYVLRYGNPQGVSGGFTNSQNNSSGSKGVQLAAKRKVKYGDIVLNGEAMAAAEGNKGAFYDLVTMETEGILQEMGDSFAFDLYRSGNGIRGQRATGGLSGNAVTLVTVDDARNFKVGMTVGASPNSDGSVPRVGTTTVAQVDEDAGTVTLANAGSITSFSDLDYLFRDGDPGTCMEGLEVLTPLTAPITGDSFRGIDRSVDTRRLAGVRVSDTNTTIEENAGLIAVKIAQVGQVTRPDECYLNPIRFWQVARRENAKVMYEAGADATYGFQAINIATPAGVLKCFSDPDCPTNRIRVVSSKFHYLKHLRPLPHIIDDDGLPSLRSTSADQIEARARGWVNLIQPVAGAHGVGAI
jgi:hypothetical protein